MNTKITDRLSLKSVRLSKKTHFENKIRYSKNEIISGGISLEMITLILISRKMIEVTMAERS